MSQTTEKRFWSKVDIGRKNRCWKWQGATDGHNVGAFGWGRGSKRLIKAPRAAWILTHGSIPKDRPFILHKCDNPICVNPNHLFPGTQTDNMQDCSRKGRVRNFGVNFKFPLRGSMNGNSKLLARQVRMIRRRRPKEKISLLAKEFKVSRSLISHIEKRRIWKHL